MNWIRSWIDKRHMRELKRRIAKMKAQFDEVQVDLGMPTLETISGRILHERIVLLEKAVETMEAHDRPVDK